MIFGEENEIPKANIVSCAADTSVMMGKKSGSLKLLKDDNLDLLTVHCVMH